MKITRTLSRRCDGMGRSEVLLRLTVDHFRQYRLKSGVFVDRSWWRDGAIDAPCGQRLEGARTAERLAALERNIYTVCSTVAREMLTADYVRTRVGLSGSEKTPGITDYLPEFVCRRRLSESRRRQYDTLAGMLRRYEASAGRRLPAEAWDGARVADFVRFLRTEHHTAPSQRPRGHNTVCSVLSRLRTLLHYIADVNGLPPQPLKGCDGLLTEVYGTPFYLEAEEVERVASADFAGRPALAVQRDVFVFQCMTGVRISDLARLRAENINSGALEYVAEKTRHARPVVVRVPLHPEAMRIVLRYKGLDRRGRLLPVLSAPRYNRAIRAVLAASGVDRLVTVLDPLTQQERRRPIAEVAGSHLARRTFIGNLYRHAKDPCLIGALSGHKDGSKAFARYRCIDDSIKRELIEQTFCRQNHMDI